MNWAFWLQLFKRSAGRLYATRWIDILIHWRSQLAIHCIVIYPVDIFPFWKTGALTDNILFFFFWIQNILKRCLCFLVETLYYIAVSLVSSTLYYWLRDFYKDMNFKKTVTRWLFNTVQTSGKDASILNMLRGNNNTWHDKTGSVKNRNDISSYKCTFYE